MKQIHAWVWSVWCVGCAASSSQPQEGPVDAGPAPVPRVRFLVDATPQAITRVEVESAEARYGDPVRVVVEGLPPGVVAVVEGRTNGMRSWASLQADVHGVVDLGRDTPQAGSWDEADVDGIFHSMTQETPAPSRLDLDLAVTASVEDMVVAQGTLHRRYVNEGLVTERVSDGTRQGMFVRPDGDGPFPAVMVFGGSEGGTSSGVFDAYYLGSLGYAALGVGYFGATGLPSSLEEVPLEILEADLAFLSAHDHVDATRIAVMGGSRGGELALILGARFPVVKAVVANVPSGVVWGATTNTQKSAWSWAGNPLPWMPYSGAQPVVTTDARGAVHYAGRNVFELDLAAATPEQLEAATIHVEDTQGPVLLLASADDQVWPSCAMSQLAMERLVGRNHPGAALDRMLCLEGAGHMVGVPGWSTMDAGEDVFIPGEGIYLVLGGTPKATARAQRTADTAMRGFLEQALR